MKGVAETMARAVALYRGGDLAAARREAEAGLDAAAPDSGLLRFVGHICCRMGDFTAGARYLHRCLERDPGDEAARIDLARALLALGAFDEAEALCAVGAAGPDAKAELARIRGYIYQSRGQPGEAASCYEAVVAKHPGDFETWNNLGNARRESGDGAGAIAALERAARLRPDLAILQRNLGGALADAGRLEESREALVRAVRLAPGDPGMLVELGRALGRLDRHSDAMAPLEEAARLAPDDPEVRVELGLAHSALDALGAAEAAYRAAIETHPEHAPAYAQLALLLDSTNRADEIGPLMQAAAAAGVPDEALAFARALQARREGRLEEALALAEAAPPSTEPHRKAQLIGELLDRLGHPEEAFAAFTEMNSTLAGLPSKPRSGVPAYRSELEALTALTTAEFYAGWRPTTLAPTRPAPAFLLGFPRSGTTLLDTVLMGHPRVQVVEERPLLEPVLARLGSMRRLPALEASEIEELRSLYFERLDRYAPDPDRLAIDKMPLNIAYTALIHRIFPDARFIFSERHPADVVLSCFITNFRLNPAMANFLDLGDAARLYGLLMTHWQRCRSVLPLQVHTVRYEEMIADLEGAVRPLIAFLGLPWDDAVLDHQKTARGRGYVASASYAQVTEPIYARASGRWRRYAKQMKEVLPLLAPWAERLGYDM
jgi:tetratricopeptide (TPR) repeat protein